MRLPRRGTGKHLRRARPRAFNRGRRVLVKGNQVSPGVQMILSGALTFGVPILYAAGELVSLKRRRPGRGFGPDEPPAPPPRPVPNGHSPAQKPLPACLIPNMRPARVRDLEPV